MPEMFHLGRSAGFSAAGLERVKRGWDDDPVKFCSVWKKVQHNNPCLQLKMFCSVWKKVHHNNPCLQDVQTHNKVMFILTAKSSGT